MGIERKLIVEQEATPCFCSRIGFSLDFASVALFQEYLCSGFSSFAMRRNMDSEGGRTGMSPSCLVGLTGFVLFRDEFSESRPLEAVHAIPTFTYAMTDTDGPTFTEAVGARHSPSLGLGLAHRRPRRRPVMV